MRLVSSPIRSYLRDLREGRVSCEKKVREELSTISGYNDRLNAFTTVFSGEKGLAISRGRELDSRRGEGKATGGLCGLPITLKDNVFFGGFPTTDGSVFFRDFVPSVNAEIADALLEAGCVPLGKTNQHELALGVSSTSALGGPIRNPHDHRRISGGSSGGSAVSVALSKGAIASIGTDTGGSVRIPAALCGTCGFKPSFGLISTAGVFPLSPTLDHVGLLTKTVEDAAFVLETLGLVRKPSTKTARIGVPDRYFTSDMDDTVARDFSSTVDRLREEPGFSVTEVKVKPDDFAAYSRARATITFKEGSWFYEQVLRSPQAKEAMHADVYSLMHRGLRTGMIEYMRAMEIKNRATRIVGGLLSELDAMVMPTCLVVAPRVDEILGKEAGEMRALLLRNTEAFNTSGLPALSLPMQSEGSLPTAIQLVGRFGEDGRVLAIGERVSRAISRKKAK